MHIIYIHQYFATPFSSSGTRSYEMAKRFVKNGHEVTFITSSAFLEGQFDFSYGWNDINYEGMTLHVLHLPYSNHDSYFSRITKFVKFCAKSTIKSLSVKADLVFATSTPLTVAIPGLVYAKLKNKPLVFEVRDLWPELPVAIGAIKNPVLIKLATLLERFTYKNSQRVIGLSPGMCDGIKKHGISDDKVVLATNSCDTELFDIDDSVGKEFKNQELSFVGKRKLIVYTGTFGVINDVSYIVDLAKASLTRHPELCFLAIGDGKEKDKVRNYAQNEGVLENNLYVLDSMPKTELVKLLSCADLSLSLFGPVKEMWHNSANKLFDALASRTPIAINYGGWQSEFITEHECGLVLDRSDVEASSDCIYTFLSDKTGYQSAVESCRNLAYNHFSRDIMAMRIEKTFLEVVSND